MPRGSGEKQTVGGIPFAAGGAAAALFLVLLFVLSAVSLGTELVQGRELWIARALLMALSFVSCRFSAGGAGASAPLRVLCCGGMLLLCMLLLGVLVPEAALFSVSTLLNLLCVLAGAGASLLPARPGKGRRRGRRRRR